MGVLHSLRQATSLINWGNEARKLQVFQKFQDTSLTAVHPCGFLVRHKVATLPTSHSSPLSIYIHMYIHNKSENNNEKTKHMTVILVQDFDEVMLTTLKENADSTKILMTNQIAIVSDQILNCRECSSQICKEQRAWLSDISILDFWANNYN